MNQQYLSFTNLPFTPSIDDIIYFDGSESLKVERWRIEFFFDEVTERLQQLTEYMDFEHARGSLYKALHSIIQTPSFWTYYSDDERRNIEDQMISPIPQGCCRENDEHPFAPSFLVYHSRTDAHTTYFTRYPITRENPPQQVLAQILKNLQERDELEGKLFARNMELTHDPDGFVVDSALRAARAAINKLRRLGVDESTIRQLLVCNEQPYELHILNNGRFYAIPRHKDPHKESQPVEVRLSPLEKAVYILFLNHPEGIMFSYLPDHREELMRYYRQLMNYRTNQQMLKSVEDVTDPTLNSINEKCARIRRIFIDSIGEENADNYCVTGTRNSPKGIRLDRNLVHCQIG